MKRKFLFTAAALGSALLLATAAMAAGPSQAGGFGSRQGSAVHLAAGTSQTAASGLTQRTRQKDGTCTGEETQSRDRVRDGSGFLEEALANLSDDDKATLSSYIDAYETAVDAAKDAMADAESGVDLSSCREAIQDAAKALQDAAKDADIQLPMGRAMGMSALAGPHGTFGLDTAIANLSDDDKTTLSTYIDAYETAVDAEKAAAAAAEEGADLSSYCEAVQNAAKALLDAAKDAGIDLLPDCKTGMPAFGGRHGISGTEDGTSSDASDLSVQ